MILVDAPLDMVYVDIRWQLILFDVQICHFISKVKILEIGTQKERW